MDYHQLAEERRWETRNGMILFGRALASPDVGWIEIQKRKYKGPGPNTAIVPLDELKLDDQVLLIAAMPKMDLQTRRYAVLVPFPVQPEWSDLQPKTPMRYTKAIAVEADQILFREGNELYAVHKSSFTANSYSAILAQYQAHGGGRAVRLPSSTQLGAVFGKLLGESETDFVLQTIDSQEGPSVPIAIGTLYRLPKYLVPQAETEVLQHVLNRCESPELNIAINESELTRMICTRQLGNQLAFIDPVQDPKQSWIDVHTGAKNPTNKEPLVRLSCKDLVAFERERLRSESISDEKRNEIAILKVAEAAKNRTEWSWGKGKRIINGNLRAKIADGFAFTFVGSERPFFVQADELSEVDRSIAIIATEQSDDDWLDRIDLGTIFENRLLDGTTICRLGTENIDVDEAIQGPIPVLNYALGGEIVLNVANVKALMEIQAARKWLRENKELLANADKKNTIAKLNKLSPATPKVTPSLNSLPLEAKVEDWRLLSDSSLSAALVGQHGDDWVFSLPVGEQSKYFLVSPSMLTPEAKRRGQGMLPILKSKTGMGN